MNADLRQKLDDVIRLHLETKADIEAMGAKLVAMAACLEKLLRAERIGGCHMDGTQDFAGVSSIEIKPVLHEARRLLGYQPVRYTGDSDGTHS